MKRKQDEPKEKNATHYGTIPRHLPDGKERVAYRMHRLKGDLVKDAAITSSFHLFPDIAMAFFVSSNFFIIFGGKNFAVLRYGGVSLDI